MLLLPRAVRVYVATSPCNLKKSFEGLSNEVRQVLAKHPLSGHVFVFLNRRKTQVKLVRRLAPVPLVPRRPPGPLLLLVHSASEAELEVWLDRVVDAPTLEAVVAASH